MSHALTLRLTVHDPVPGILLLVQRRRDELVPPVTASAEAVTFEFTVETDIRDDGRVVCHGPEVQGPPAGRFVYVNAGQCAGQLDTAVRRRAKVPLTGLTNTIVATAHVLPAMVVAAAIAGRARDGGPAAATVPLLGAGWTVVPRDG